MKKLMYFVAIIALFAGVVVYFSLPVHEDKKTEEVKKTFVHTENVGVDNPIVVKYSEYNGQPIEIEYDSIQGRISLRVHEDWVCGGDKELEALKTKVSEIFISKETIVIGNSGYSLQYLGGFPEWSPYHSLGPSYSNACLLFSSKTTLKNKVFYVVGENDKRGYYPYSDTVGRAL